MKTKHLFFIILLSLCLPWTTTAQTVLAYTSYTATSGTSTNNNESYSHLLDNDTRTKWCVTNFNGAYVEFYCAAPIEPLGYILTTANDTGVIPGRNPKSWTIKAKLNPDDDWTTIVNETDNYSMPAESCKDQYFIFDQLSNTYQYFRFDVSATQGANVMQLSEFKFLVSDGQGSCFTPFNLQCSVSSATTATLSWQQYGSATSWQICLNNDEANLIDVTENPYTITGLTPVSGQTIKIRSNCGEQQSNWSDPVNLNFSSYKPSNLQCIPTSSTTASLTWTENGTATAWQICLNNDMSNLIDVTEKPYTITNLNPYTTNTVKVRATYGDSHTDWSTAASINFSSYKPSNLQCTPTSPSTATLTWTENGTATAWQICLNDDMSNLIDVTEKPYTITGLFPNVSYTVKVRATYGDFNTDWSNALSFDFSSYMPSNLQCTPTSPSTATLTWTENGTATAWQICLNDDMSNLIDVTENTHTITGLTPNASYTVKVRATYSDIYTFWSNAVSFEQIAERPTNLQCTPTSPSTATLTWTENGTATAWQICLNDDMSNLIDVTENTHTITGLTPNASYTVKVRSIYDNGQSNWSDAMSFDFSAYKPFDLECITLSPITVKVSWIDENQPIGWQICLNGDMDNLIDATTNTWVINYLVPDVSYTVMVRSIFTDGPGVWTNPVSFDFSAYRPANFQCDVTTPTKAIVQWDDDEFATSWQICFNDDMENLIDVTYYVYAFDSLTPNATYSVKVRSVFGDNGTSVWTDVINFQQIVPKPINLEYTVSSLTSVILYWSELATATSWQICINDDMDNLIETNRQQHTFTNLTPDGTYTFKVRSVYDNGLSQWSDPITILLTVSQPTNLQCTATSTATTLQWTENGNATAWQICLNNDESNLIDVTDNPYTLTNLSINATYFAKVRSVYDDGQSNWSDTIRFMTTDKTVIPDPTVTINSTPILPTYLDFYYSLTQQIYTVEELGIGGNILSIDFYMYGSRQIRRYISIYMEHTDKNEYDSKYDYIPVTSITSNCVFRGYVTFRSNDWTTITLDTPFAYDGQHNVVITIDDNTNSSFEEEIDFQSYSAGSYQSLFLVYQPLYGAYDFNPTEDNNWQNMMYSRKNAIRVCFDYSKYHIANTASTTAMTWNQFVEKLNSGCTYEGKTIYLDEDITNSVGMAGLSDDRTKCFHGTFDGLGHTIPINWTVTGSCRGLFGSAMNATFKNLKVTGSITSSATAAGGLVGRDWGGCTYINCESNVNITSTKTGDASCGGFVGLVQDNSSYFEGCVFTGELLGSGAYACGGFVGWINANTTVGAHFSNCVFAPTEVTMSNDWSATFSRGNANNLSFTNCYYTQPFGASQGKQMYSISAISPVSLEMNGIAKTHNLSHITFYRDNHGMLYNNTLIAGENDYVVINLSGADTYYANYGSIEQAANPYFLIMAAHNTAISNTVITYHIVNTVTDPETQMTWNQFAEFVNGGYTYEDENVYLDEDITATTTVGINGTNCFKGTFEGQGHTLTFNYTTTAWYMAPFRFLNGATVKNLKVDGNLNCNARCGGFVGECYGDVTFTNCVSDITINSSKEGDGTHGGFVSVVRDGTTTFNGCAFTGRLLGSETNRCSGFVGWMPATATAVNFNNCVFAPKEITMEHTYCASFMRGSCNISNSYHTYDFNDGTNFVGQGKQMYSITAQSPITMYVQGTATTYDVSHIETYNGNSGMRYNDIMYAGTGDNVRLNLTGYGSEVSNIFVHNATLTISGPFTITLQGGNVDILSAYYSTDFETSGEWTFVNGERANRWCWGTAAHNGSGTHAIYISNDNGTSNAYTIENKQSMVYAYKTFNLDAGSYGLTFDWRSNGDFNNADYIRAVLIPDSVTLQADHQPLTDFSKNSLPSGWIALDGGTALYGSTTWQNTYNEFYVPTTGTYKLAYAWYNDFVYGENPPAAIDNMTITLVGRPAPIDLQCTATTVTTATLAWTELGDATSWQICLNGDEANSILADSNPFTLTGLTYETPYTAKVRAFKDGEVSAWSNIINFSPSAKIQVGSGDGNNTNLPLNNFYGFSLTQQIYTVAELGNAGSIVSIDFYKVTDVTCSRNIDIYMVHTDKNAFSTTDDWVSVTSADRVFSGTVNFTTNAWTPISLDTPFAYDGQHNVIITVDDNTGSYSNTTYFLTFGSTANQSLYHRNDNNNYDPTDTPGEATSYLNVKNQIRVLKTSTKAITGYGENDGNWCLISSPLANTTDADYVTNLTSNAFDLYRFDQSADLEWENWKTDGDNYHFALETGIGYLYANNADVTLKFNGETYSGEGQITLDYDATVQLKGWNLIGNPFSTAATLNMPFYRMNSSGTELSAQVEANNTVEAMEGVFVKATATGQNANFTPVSPGNAKTANAVHINLSSNKGETIDNAIIRFDGGQSLDKFALNEGTKLYIPIDGTDYAIISAGASGELPVSFKATTDGSYTISVNPENVEMKYLHLIDNLTGADTDLLKVSSYTFEATSHDDANRFRLVYETL